MSQPQLLVLHQPLGRLDPWTPAARSAKNSNVAVLDISQETFSPEKLAARVRYPVDGLILDESHVENGSTSRLESVIDALRPAWLLIVRAYRDEDIDITSEDRTFSVGTRKIEPAWILWRFPSDALGSIVHIWVDIAAWSFQKNLVLPKIIATHGPLTEGHAAHWNARPYADLGATPSANNGPFVSYLSRTEEGTEEAPFTPDFPARIPSKPQTFMTRNGRPATGVIYRGGPLSANAVRIWTDTDIAYVLGVEETYKRGDYKRSKDVWLDLSRILPVSFAETLLNQVSAWT